MRAEILGRLRIVMIIVLSCILASFLVIGILLFIYSPGKLDNFTDGEGNKIEDSISEKIYVEINGVKQGMFIQGKNRDNPVLLFVHGGPIMPEYFLNDIYHNNLTDDFNVCWWEQPGVGLSYDSNISKQDLTVDSIVEDTIEVTNFLRSKFNKDKIYILGHSWGSFIAIQAAYKNPELYNAYIGMGQITNQKESEKMAYEYMLDQYYSQGNNKIIKKLNEYSVDNDEELIKYFKSSLRDEAMHELGIGTAHNMNSVITGVFLPTMKCRAYTLPEKINIWRGKAYVRNNTTLINDYLFADVPSMISELKVPCYFMSGIYDYTVSWKLVKDYYQSIKAPVKGFYLFDNSAHSPMFEEPDKFIDIMRNYVLNNGGSY